ncbi:tyrosine-type recombinase/integrase [Spirosoma aerolatum]|uniref:tyrosine-type recombinase/integrase n=1 Tax=Spirosoma aerolatum TaxID=1211326 RepID=UPI0009AF1734|nr:site-specific integrase [Spirosoma aerolatum]
MSKATVNLFFDKRASKAGEGVIKWLVCLDRKQRLFTTGQRVTTDEWAFLQASKNKLDNRIKDEEKRALWHRIYGDQFTDESGKKQTGYFKRAQDIVDQLGSQFSFDAFANDIVNYGKDKEVPVEQADVIAALQAQSAKMKKADRIGNAELFDLSAKSLRRFVDSFSDEERKEFLGIPLSHRKITEPRQPDILRFEHLTPNFLTTYEQWMQKHGNVRKPGVGASLTTIGIYLRHLRAVVNDAIEADIVPRNAYPFGPNGYVIPAGSNPKKALAKADIDKFKAYQPLPGTMEQRSHDLWLFTYYCNGINLTDICHLTWSQVDLKGGKLSFVRQKTSRSRKQNQTQIIAHLRPETLAIIDRWAIADKSPNSYVFPFLTSDMDARRRKDIVKQITLITNRWTRKIANSLGIEADTTTYSARHSFATVLLKSKASLAFISKSLGHTNLKTTESYLGSFDDEEAKSFLEAL